ncbi:nitrate reductase cytochrome c-type subunit [Candidatus Uabimicrobium sp. HlEnr_7]|uniref:nitrate reductase cytochrome c-type subunit n=1 Tax=Candidatus Uabimicrobium helgolandensis TaxID=3095367 RepID=UPI00355730AC
MRIILYFSFLIATAFFFITAIDVSPQRKPKIANRNMSVPVLVTPSHTKDNYSMPSKYWQARKYAKAKERTLKEFYARRAYPGAPPVIPHKIEKNSTEMCLTCHEKGGYTPQYNAYAPPTPHSDFISCWQCHVPQQEMHTNNLWQQLYLPKLQQKAQLTGPLVIPHSLHMRTKCIVCHAGPAAIKEIRTSHPERVHCLQCHVTQKKDDRFRRKNYEGKNE